VASTLPEPFRHAFTDFFWADQLAAVRLANTSLDLVKQIEAIEGVLNTGILGQFLDCPQYLLLRLHADSPNPACILAHRTPHQTQRAASSTARLGRVPND